MKAHEKAAESEFSSFDDFEESYAGEEEFDGEENFEDFASTKKRAGKIKLNTLKIRLVSDNTVAAGGVNVPLFGAFVNMYVAGLNVPAGVTVTGQPTAYSSILATSLSKPWTVSGLKIIVGGASPASQLNQNFNVATTDLTGRAYTDPYFPSDNFSAFQQQAGVIEMKDFSEDIDGNTTMNYPVLPSQTVDLIFYLRSQVDPTRLAMGKNPLGVSNRSFPNPNKQMLVIRNK